MTPSARRALQKRRSVPGAAVIFLVNDVPGPTPPPPTPPGIGVLVQEFPRIVGGGGGRGRVFDEAEQITREMLAFFTDFVEETAIVAAEGLETSVMIDSAEISIVVYASPETGVNVGQHDIADSTSLCDTSVAVSEFDVTIDSGDDIDE